MKTSWPRIWRQALDAIDSGGGGIRHPFFLSSGNDASYVSGCVHSFARAVYPSASVVTLLGADVAKDPKLLPRSLTPKTDLFASLEEGEEYGPYLPEENFPISPLAAMGSSTSHHKIQKPHSRANPKVCVLIEQASDRLTSTLPRILDTLEGQHFLGSVPIILWSSKLSKSSSLRRFIEGHPSLSFVPTYAPDKPFFQSHASYLLESHHLSIKDQDKGSFMDTLGAVTGWASEGLDQALTKLLLYAQSKSGTDATLIETQDIWACLAPPEPESLAFILALLERDAAKVVATSEAARKTEPISLIYQLIFYLTKLQELQSLAQGGYTSTEKLVYNLRPVLPPPINAALILGAKKWSPSALKLMLARVHQAEKEQKLQTSAMIAFITSCLMRAV